MINSWFANRFFNWHLDEAKKNPNKHTFCLLFDIIHYTRTKMSFRLVYLFIHWLIGDKKNCILNLHRTPSAEHFFPYICFLFEVNHHWSNKGFLFDCVGLGHIENNGCICETQAGELLEKHFQWTIFIFFLFTDCKIRITSILLQSFKIYSQYQKRLGEMISL